MDEQAKFYRTVEVVRKQSDDVEWERGHHQLATDRLTGRLAFDLVAFQPIHVGNGRLLPPDALGLAVDAPLVKTFFRVGETPTIPGSSLKGAIRSLVELFTHSCVSKTRVRWERDEKEDYGECRYDSRRHRGDLCPACKLFGAMGYQGQVRFDDAPLAEGNHQAHWIPPQYKSKSERDLRRYYPYELSDDRPATWPLEVAMEGARFAAQAQFTNLTSAELGLLLIALGQGEWKLCPRMGAGKSSGLGGTHVNHLIVQRWQVRQAYQTFDSNAWEAVDVEACIRKAQTLVRVDVLADLARDLRATEGG